MKTGILLVNLGTPQSSSVSAVRRYLREFLMDPFVIDLPWLVRKILVELILLKRPQQSAEAYQSIWLPGGSPLLVHTQELQQALSQTLADGAQSDHYQIEIAMRYQTPSIAEGLRKLSAGGINCLIVLPLFPQYSRAVTESIIKKVNQEVLRQKISIPLFIHKSFCYEPAYIKSSAKLVKKAMDSINADYVLFSYHGLPERQMRYNPDYKKECVDTSEAIANELQLTPSLYQTSFQSRLGRTPWLQPYTDLVIDHLRAQGVKRLAVACPSFVIDCLETLEEIGIRAREQWLAAGGEDFVLVPALNTSPEWVRALAERLKSF